MAKSIARRVQYYRENDSSTWAIFSTTQSENTCMVMDKDLFTYFCLCTSDVFFGIAGIGAFGI